PKTQNPFPPSSLLPSIPSVILAADEQRADAFKDAPITPTLKRFHKGTIQPRVLTDERNGSDERQPPPAGARSGARTAHRRRRCRKRVCARARRERLRRRGSRGRREGFGRARAHAPA